MDKEILIPQVPPKFGYPQILLTEGFSHSRGSAGSEWGRQILKYADDFKL